MFSLIRRSTTATQGKRQEASSVGALKGVALVLALVSLPAMAQGVTPPPGEGFSFGWLQGYARNLANEPYTEEPAGNVAAPLQKLDSNSYQNIQARVDGALWAQQEDSPFRAAMFPLAADYQTPVHIYRLKDGNPIPVGYRPDLFDFSKTDIDATALPVEGGFAGWKLLFHTDWQRDIVAFLGKSYFRATGREMQYGIHARGLAINSGLPRPEELPVFTHFWLQNPTPGSDVMTVFALMDSPSVTGAYRFDITPGSNLKMQVSARVYPRAAIEQIGIAPLNSMYLNGENDRRVTDDWRPEVHDSDGLALHTGNDQWIWRPLSNPHHQQVNAYIDNDPKGFGLMQRDRNFDHYQDDVANYNARPSLWVEPTNNWGEGAVQLVEMPTKTEANSNVIAFWKPKQAILPGQQLTFNYNLYWGSQPPAKSHEAHVVNTFTGLHHDSGEDKGERRRFVVDFEGGLLPMLGEKAQLKPQITTSAGTVKPISIRRLHHDHTYRVIFDSIPQVGNNKPINLHLSLINDQQTISESWFYQWTPDISEVRVAPTDKEKSAPDADSPSGTASQSL